MYRNDVNVNIPNELLEEMEIQGTIVSPIYTEMGILVLSKGMIQFSRDVTIRIYYLKQAADRKSYDVYYELEAFSFTNYNEAKKFIKHLPKMSGIEMLLLLNPEPNVQ